MPEKEAARRASDLGRREVDKAASTGGTLPDLGLPGLMTLLSYLGLDQAGVEDTAKATGSGLVLFLTVGWRLAVQYRARTKVADEARVQAEVARRAETERMGHRQRLRDTLLIQVCKKQDQIIEFLVAGLPIGAASPFDNAPRTDPTASSLEEALGLKALPESKSDEFRRLVGEDK